MSDFFHDLKPAKREDSPDEAAGQRSDTPKQPGANNAAQPGGQPVPSAPPTVSPAYQGSTPPQTAYQNPAQSTAPYQNSAQSTAPYQNQPQSGGLYQDPPQSGAPYQADAAPQSRSPYQASAVRVPSALLTNLQSSFPGLQAKFKAIASAFSQSASDHYKPRTSGFAPPSAREDAPAPPPEAEEFEDELPGERIHSFKPGKSFARLQAEGNWKGFGQHLLVITTEVITSPEAFFRKMPLTGNLKESMTYLFLVAFICAVFQAVLRWNFLGLFGALVNSIVSVLVGAFVSQYAFEKLGGKGSRAATIKVFAYSRATLLIAWIWLGPIPVGGIIAGLYSIYLNFVGMERVHQLEDRKTAAMVLIILAAIGFALKLHSPI